MRLWRCVPARVIWFVWYKPSTPLFLFILFLTFSGGCVGIALAHVYMYTLPTIKVSFSVFVRMFPYFPSLYRLSLRITVLCLHQLVRPWFVTSETVPINITYRSSTCFSRYPLPWSLLLLVILHSMLNLFFPDSMCIHAFVFTPNHSSSATFLACHSCTARPGLQSWRWRTAKMGTKRGGHYGPHQ